MPFNMPADYNMNNQRGYDPMQMTPMPDPKMSYSPVDMAGDQAAAAESVGDTVRPATLQPGDRKSMREYLAEIRELREQMRVQGVAEDQLPVPTFTTAVRTRDPWASSAAATTGRSTTSTMTRGNGSAV